MHQLGPKKLPTWKPIKVYKYTNKQLHRLPETKATLVLGLIVLVMLASVFQRAILVVVIILVVAAIAGLVWFVRLAKNRTTKF